MSELPVMSTNKPAGIISPAVYLLALSLFAMGSAEFLMGGILPMIATDLQMSLPKAGTFISAFAMGALTGGPPFAILTLRLLGRETLFISQLAFIIATVISLIAQDYWFILIARFAMGLAYACFWAVAAATAVQLPPPDSRARAISIVVSGLSIAMIFGGPAGTLISDFTGWRGGFWAVITVTSLSAITGWLALPKRDSAEGATTDLDAELQAMKRPALWVAYATTMVTTAVYMGSFSYLGALLLDISGLEARWLPAVLTLFGVGAFIGLSVGGRTADSHPFSTLVIGIIGLLITSTGLALLASHDVMIIGLVFVLGFTGFLLNPAVWSQVYILAPDAPMLAGATNSCAFQAGLTIAPLLAGLPVSLGYGLPSVGWVGVALAISALGLAFLGRRMGRVSTSQCTQ